MRAIFGAHRDEILAQNLKVWLLGGDIVVVVLMNSATSEPEISILNPSHRAGNGVCAFLLHHY